MKQSISIVLLVVLISCGISKKIYPVGEHGINGHTMVVELGVEKNSISPKWKSSLTTRMSSQNLEEMSLIKRPLTIEELAWQDLIKSRTNHWNQFRDSLRLPFGDIPVEDTITVLLGYLGVDDGFTYGYGTVCFDLTALQTNYGSANLAENKNRMDRLFAHEFTHLLHKEWVRKNDLKLNSFRDSILWECLYEGIGMYRSLTTKWLPAHDSLPLLTKTTLAELYPIFDKKIARINSPDPLTNEEKTTIQSNLSRGMVSKKWGAFPMAIWLALEAKGDDRNLIPWISKGPSAVLMLADKYLRKM